MPVFERWGIIQRSKLKEMRGRKAFLHKGEGSKVEGGEIFSMWHKFFRGAKGLAKLDGGDSLVELERGEWSH